MSVLFQQKGDSLTKRESDPGYRIGWRSKLKFEKGHLDGEMTYGEACVKAAELAAQDPSKTFFAEPILTEITV